MTKYKERGTIKMPKYVKPTYERVENPDSKGQFFVRLAYGVVGSYRDTKNMTTPEVIEEFLDHNGVKTPREFFKEKFRGGDKPETKPGTEQPKEQPKQPERPKEKSAQAQEIISELKQIGVEYNEVKDHNGIISSDEIITRLAGGDMTVGSCSSLAFAYIGNKCGYDVLDFRGGESRSYFSTSRDIRKVLSLPGVQSKEEAFEKEIPNAIKILNSFELNVEYYFVAGKHAAIVRKTESGLEYLELQSNDSQRNGWNSFNRYGSTSETLYRRFGCRKTAQVIRIGDRKLTIPQKIFYAKVDSFKDSLEYKEILGYINTNVDKQKKGKEGNVK